MGELCWSEEQAMSVSGHKSAEQMRRDYNCGMRIETTVALEMGQEPSENARALLKEPLSVSQGKALEIAREKSGSRAGSLRQRTKSKKRRKRVCMMM